MKQGSISTVMAMLRAGFGDPEKGRPASVNMTPHKMYRQAPQRDHRIKHLPYKSLFSVGFRGHPRRSYPFGTIPAPTIDQVRNLERKFNVRLDVRRGLMYHRGTDGLFDHKAALASLETCNG